MELILWSSGSAHARRLDEALGGIVDVAAGSAAGRMNIELRSFHYLTVRRRPWRQRQFVMDRPSMIRQHLLDIVDLAVIHDGTHEIGLPSDQIAREHTSKHRRGPPGHMLAVEHSLGV